MFYSMSWDIRRSDPETVHGQVLKVLSAVGARATGEGCYPGSIGVDFPFLFQAGRHIGSPHASLRVFVPEGAGPGDVRVDLDCSIGVVWDPEHALHNLRLLIACGDRIYGATAPALGWAHDHTYAHPDITDFLTTGLPIGAQFVYVGSELVNMVNWPEMKGRPYVVTAMPDGGVRVENLGPLTVPSLDL